jgi:hypothetical protein
MRSAEGAPSCQLRAAETAAETDVTEQTRSGPHFLLPPGSIELLRVTIGNRNLDYPGNNYCISSAVTASVV